MNPILTVGIPVHNESRYIRQTLESIAGQSFPDFRVVISENCSEDNSYAILKEFADRDDRFTVIRQQTKLSALDNFRFVMNQANTPYFMWLGGHDLLLSDFIARGIAILAEQKNVALVYPEVLAIDTEGNRIEGVSDLLNEDLDSKNLSFIDRLCKMARNSFSCYANYGIMRTESTLSIPFKKMVGTDHLILFHLAVQGDFVWLRQPGISARVHRVETQQERKTRYIREGIMSGDDHFPYENHALQYFIYVLKSPSIRFPDKWKLLFRLKSIFRQKFNVHTRGLVRLCVYKLIKR